LEQPWPEGCREVVRRNDFDKSIRHQTYVKAVTHYGVTCVLGHYISQPAACHRCNASWTAQSEKETDSNLALSVLDDAYQGLCDHFYLVTADSDQAATARMRTARFPGKPFTTVAPPGRNFSASILQHTKLKNQLSEAHLERCLLPGAVMADEGTLVARRPVSYAPPPGWLPPDHTGLTKW
jgi:hypothetical protein